MPWSATPWGKLLMLAVIFTAALTAFFTKSATWRWLAVSLTLAYLGFIDGGFLSVSHITSVIGQGVEPIVSNIPLLALVLFTGVTTLLWGRVFCSSLCPFGALQDFITRFTPRRWKRTLPRAVHEHAYWIKYLFLGVIVVSAVFAAQVSIFQYFEPFGTLFFFSASPLLWSILALVLVGCVVIPRFYCRYLCPLGAALGLVSLISPLRIKRVDQCQVCSMCEHACPTGAIRGPTINFIECVRCDVCEAKLKTRAGSCRHAVSEINQRLSHAAPIRVLHEGPGEINPQ